MKLNWIEKKPTKYNGVDFCPQKIQCDNNGTSQKKNRWHQKIWLHLSKEQTVSSEKYFGVSKEQTLSSEKYFGGLKRFNVIIMEPLKRTKSRLIFSQKFQCDCSFHLSLMTKIQVVQIDNLTYDIYIIVQIDKWYILGKLRRILNLLWDQRFNARMGKRYWKYRSNDSLGLDV